MGALNAGDVGGLDCSGAEVVVGLFCAVNLNGGYTEGANCGGIVLVGGAVAACEDTAGWKDADGVELGLWVRV